MPRALDQITDALTIELQEAHRDIQIIRNGALQITLFRRTDFRHAQIVVAVEGIYLIVDPTRDVPQMDLPENLRGPFPLEDPKMLSYLELAIDQWLKSQL